MILFRQEGFPDGAEKGIEIDLSRLIDLLNERFRTNFKPADQLFFESIKEDALADAKLRQSALVNTMEGFSYVFLKALEGLFIDRMDQNREITTKFINEKDFQKEIENFLMKQVYDRIRDRETTGTN